MTALRLLARRALASVGTLLAVSLLLFAGAQVTPGDAASASLGANATPDQVAALRAAWGLDRPFPQRYADWILAFGHGDLGTSLTTGTPVTAVIGRPFAASAVLVALAGSATVVLAGLVGVLAGLRPGSTVDRVLSGAAVAVVAIPQFVVAGLLVLVFAAGLQLLPAVSLLPFGGTPLDRPSILVLPALALVLPAAAWASRVVRATVIDAGAATHVDAARLAGLPEPVVVLRHLLPATLPACAQLFGWLVSALFGGTAVVEQVFGYPGLSRVLTDAVRHHDPAVLAGVGLLLAVLVVVALLVADVIGVLADPRLRTAQAR
jgi:peptide/nickel transport system permease protein